MALPWCFTALMAALNFQIDPFLSFLEGCGYVPEVARLRFMQSVTGSLLAWGALSSHHGLFAPSMMLLGMASIAVWLVGKHKLLLGLLGYYTGRDRIRWSEEVWPFQWRIAVSWFCGYFIFWLFNPVLFAFRGPVEAGQMGMSLSLVNAIQNIAVSWVSTKSAPFGTLVARKEYATIGSHILSGAPASLRGLTRRGSDCVAWMYLSEFAASSLCSTSSRPFFPGPFADLHDCKCHCFCRGFLSSRA